MANQRVQATLYSAPDPRRRARGAGTSAFPPGDFGKPPFRPHPPGGAARVPRFPALFIARRWFAVAVDHPRGLRPRCLFPRLIESFESHEGYQYAQ